MSAQITLNWTKDSTFETLLDAIRLRSTQQPRTGVIMKAPVLRL